MAGLFSDKLHGKDIFIPSPPPLLNLFSLQFEKDKQHDIRNFFSPVPDKKRKRTDDSSIAGSPRTPSQDQQGTNQSPCSPSPDLANQEEDFCPQVKRLKQATPLCRHGGIRSPMMLPGAPRRLSAGPQPLRHSQKWSCPLCTFSNSGLLLRCEMCETPRAQKGTSAPPHTNALTCRDSQMTVHITVNS